MLRKKHTHLTMWTQQNKTKQNKTQQQTNNNVKNIERTLLLK